MAIWWGGLGGLIIWLLVASGRVLKFTHFFFITAIKFYFQTGLLGDCCLAASLVATYLCLPMDFSELFVPGSYLSL